MSRLFETGDADEGCCGVEGWVVGLLAGLVGAGCGLGREADRPTASCREVGEERFETELDLGDEMGGECGYVTSLTADML